MLGPRAEKRNDHSPAEQLHQIRSSQVLVVVHIGSEKLSKTVGNFDQQTRRNPIGSPGPGA